MSANGLGTTQYGGFVVPDVVGNIRIDQAWGLFQISAAAHSVNGSYNDVGAFNTPVGGAGITTDSILSGHPESKLAGSVMAALQIKNIPCGAGAATNIDPTS